MNYGELKQTVLDYLQYEGVDESGQEVLNRLVEKAIKNARVWAERRRDWKMSIGVGQLVIDPQEGARLTELVDFAPFTSPLLFDVGPTFDDEGNPLEVECVLFDMGGESYFSLGDHLREGMPVRMKSVLGAYLLPNHEVNLEKFPIRIESLAGREHVDFRRQDVWTSDRWGERYGQCGSPRQAPAILLEGDRVFLPGIATPTVAEFRGYMWLDDYVGEESTDFLLTNCFDVLLWKAIIEVNHRSQIFVPRQEGTLAPPTQMLADAWEAAALWDSYLHVESLHSQRL